MTELKTNLIQKPVVVDQMHCISCKKATRCNYNLTGRKDPFCENCYMNGLPKVETLTPVKEVQYSHMIFRIYEKEEMSFFIEVDEARYFGGNEILHFILDKSFQSQEQAEEFISYYLSNFKEFSVSYEGDL